MATEGNRSYTHPLLPGGSRRTMKLFPLSGSLASRASRTRHIPPQFAPISADMKDDMTAVIPFLPLGGGSAVPGTKIGLFLPPAR
jgi:hypothetical protein